MARGRGKQRGVVGVASSALLAGLGTLLALSGCSSGEGGAEQLGVTHQAIACGKLMPCPPDNECVDWTCNTLVGMCEAKALIKEGEPCKTVAGAPGACVAGVCCTGCVLKGRDGYECGAGDTLNECGMPGEVCENCDRGNSCEEYVCEPQKRVCDSRAIADNQPCRDNSGACLSGACCSGCVKGGVCVAGDLVTQCGQSSPNAGLVACKSCDDGNVCNSDSCVNGVCAAPAPKPGDCDDATVCNGHETCGNGQCNSGPAPNCNDDKVCTVDSCDAVDGCQHVPKEAGVGCDDDDICNGISKCDGGTECIPGTPRDCDDNNPCTDDLCDPVDGCKYVNNTDDCSDNDLCTLVDKCSGGECVGSGTPNCDDNQPCTLDTCDPAKQCLHEPLPNFTECDDENGCTTDSECIAGKCQGTGGETCDDGNPCTKPTCSVLSGCTYPNDDGAACVFDACHVNSSCQDGECTAGELVKCDDNNVCTEDTCDPETGCKYTPLNSGDCSDDDLCTRADKCTNGECVGTPVTCSALDDCHLAGACDPETGACSDPRAPDRTECDDGPVPGPGSCLDGRCEAIAEGGAGGETAGGAGGTGSGNGGAPIAGEGGEPSTVPVGGTSASGASAGGTSAGGEGSEPTPGGAPGSTAGTGGVAPVAGSSSAEAGAPVDPELVFVRHPGGCSCRIPESSGSTAAGWLTGVAVLLGLTRRRRSR